MSALLQLVERGGWVIPGIVLLSVVLYSRCFRLLYSLWRLRRQLSRVHSSVAFQKLQHEARETFRRQRSAIGPMIAAAPLLGLLGTVSGMEKTFESLSGGEAGRSMDGLARGISEVLVATESGLVVALPAMLLVYLAHREVHRQMQRANRLERGFRAAGSTR